MIMSQWLESYCNDAKQSKIQLNESYHYSPGTTKRLVVTASILIHNDSTGASLEFMVGLLLKPSFVRLIVFGLKFHPLTSRILGLF